MAVREHSRIIDHLWHAGCTRREAAILLDLWRYGASTVQEVAERVEENRVTVHSAVTTLLEKGVILETRRERKRLIAAAEGSALIAFLNRKEQELSSAKANAEQALVLLQNVDRVTQATPGLRLNHGVDGFKRMLEETLFAKEEVVVATDIEKFAELVGADFLQSYYERRARLGISARLVWPYCAFVKKVQPRLASYLMKVRISRVSRGWQVGFFCWNDKLAIMSLAAGAVTCTILESPEISNFYRTVVFESLWRDSRPLENFSPRVQPKP